MTPFAFVLGAALIVALDLALYGYYRRCVAWADAQAGRATREPWRWRAPTGRRT